MPVGWGFIHVRPAFHHGVCRLHALVLDRRRHIHDENNIHRLLANLLAGRRGGGGGWRRRAWVEGGGDAVYRRVTYHSHDFFPHVLQHNPNLAHPSPTPRSRRQDRVTTRLGSSCNACTCLLSFRSTCHYDESSECAHVSINEVACYRTERTLMGCADPNPFWPGRSTSSQCPRANQGKTHAKVDEASDVTTYCRLSPSATGGAIPASPRRLGTVTILPRTRLRKLQARVCKSGSQCVVRSMGVSRYALSPVPPPPPPPPL